MVGQKGQRLEELTVRCRQEWPRSSFLSQLDGQVLSDFLAAGELVRFVKGDALIREGDPADSVSLLIDGSVKVTARLDTGGEALLAVRVGGDLIGEIAVMDGGVRTATVSAFGHEGATTVRLRQDDLHDLLTRYPDAALSLASAVSHKLRTATRRRVDITGCTPLVRIARVLLEMAEDYGHHGPRGTLIGVNLTQIEMGTLVGTGETTAQRALRALRNDGIVVSAGRRLLVPDLTALQEAAWGATDYGDHRDK